MPALTDNHLTKLRQIMSEARPGEHIPESELFDEVCALAWRYINRGQAQGREPDDD